MRGFWMALFLVGLGFGTARASTVDVLRSADKAVASTATARGADGVTGWVDLAGLREVPGPVGLLSFGTMLFGAAGVCVYKASRAKRSGLIEEAGAIARLL